MNTRIKAINLIQSLCDRSNNPETDLDIKLQETLIFAFEGEFVRFRNALAEIVLKAKTFCEAIAKIELWAHQMSKLGQEYRLWEEAKKFQVEGNLLH